MNQTPLEQKITDIITPAVKDRGLTLVSVKLNAETLQIMAENTETKNLGIDECTGLSREISALLDVEDPINGAYRLEVSSPGIDRILTKQQDFADYEGFEAKIEIDPPYEGQKRFRGTLKGMKEENVLITTDQGDIALPYESVHKAKLVLTDSLLKTGKTAS